MILMNEILYEKIIERITKDPDHQIIIFTHSRKQTYLTAKSLIEMAEAKDDLSKFLKSEDCKRILENLENSNDFQWKRDKLREIIPLGFGIHHAGLHRLDRNTVEELFADRKIQILISTATLAWGVNLPARTVIIK